MRSYEGLFILPPEQMPEVQKAQVKQLEDLIKKFNGNVSQKAEWGRRPLGYPLKKFKEGSFLLFDFEMDPAKATEFRKALQLQEGPLKFTIALKEQRRENKQQTAKAVPAAKPIRTGSAAGSQPVSSH